MAAITDDAVANLAALVGSPTTARALLQVWARRERERQREEVETERERGRSVSTSPPARADT